MDMLSDLLTDILGILYLVLSLTNYLGENSYSFFSARAYEILSSLFSKQ